MTVKPEIPNTEKPDWTPCRSCGTPLDCTGNRKCQWTQIPSQKQEGEEPEIYEVGNTHQLCRHPIGDWSLRIKVVDDDVAHIRWLERNEVSMIEGVRGRLRDERDAAVREAKINMENFRVTNQSLVKYDEARIRAEEDTAGFRLENKTLRDTNERLENERDVAYRTVHFYHERMTQAIVAAERGEEPEWRKRLGAQYAARQVASLRSDRAAFMDADLWVGIIARETCHEILRDYDRLREQLGAAVREKEFFRKHGDEWERTGMNALAALDKYKGYFHDMDRIIDDLHVAESCINPFEDLKIAITKLKARAEAAESELEAVRKRTIEAADNTIVDPCDAA